MPNDRSYEQKPTFICNAHHMLRLAAEGFKKCRSQNWMAAGVKAGGWSSSITRYPGLTDDSVSEMASHSYFCISALKKKKVCVSILNANRWLCFLRT